MDCGVVAVLIYNWPFTPVPALGTPEPVKTGKPEAAIKPGTDQVKAAVLRESTIAIDTQIKLEGEAGGAFNQPVGAVPVFVVKLQDPPVGVAGAVAES
jgi:hypothetical protein